MHQSKALIWSSAVKVERVMTMRIINARISLAYIIERIAGSVLKGPYSCTAIYAASDTCVELLCVIVRFSTSSLYA